MSAEYNATEHVQDSSVLELPFGTEIHLPSFDIPVPDYVDTNVSTKVVKIIQSYVGVVDKFVWRKEG